MGPEDRQDEAAERGQGAEPDPWIDEVVDSRYRILSLIGRGGMGRVYRAEHVAIRRQVAIKLFSPAAGGALTDRQRFSREAFASGRVTHPNCVAVSDFGTLRDGTLFLAMELLEGTTLASLIAHDSPLPVGRALHIIKHILRGLGHAHDSGIVHRDLKPQNVILVDHLGDKDFAKVLDFGLAKLIGGALIEEGGGKLTQAGITFGTPTYMAPEQALGKSLDHCADLYSTSIILFEMLTGEPPFQADDPQRVLMMHTTNPAPRLRDVNPDVDVPVDLELLIRRGMAKQPGERPQSAQGYVEAIERCEAALAEAAPAQPEPVVEPEPSPTAATVPVSPQTPAMSPAPQPAPGTLPLSPPAQIPAPAPARGQQRTLIAALVVSGVLIVSMAIALSVGGDDEPDSGKAAKPAPIATGETGEATAPAPREAAASDSTAALAEAETALRAGRLSSAEKSLRALRRKQPDNARIPYLLGNLYYQKPWPTEMIKVYRDAIEREPAYRNDADLIKHAIATLQSHSARHAAARLLERDIGAPAIPYLQQTAKGHKNPKIRERAKRILRALDAE